MIPPPVPIDILRDGHVHTKLCRHAIGEMEEYVTVAVARGLSEIVFLEHLEMGINYFERTWLSEKDFDYYFQEGARLREQYGDRITIGLGVELGYNARQHSELLAKVNSRPWDRVGISCHFLPIGDTGQHLNLLSRHQQNIVIARQLGVEQLLTTYFDSLLTAVQNLPGTMLCHLDAALRHVPDLTLTDAHLQQIDTLLAAVKHNNMAIEVNTSGFAMRREPFPAQQLLAMAIRHDIPLLAGSDAHRPEDVGRFFELLPGYITSATDS